MIRKVRRARKTKGRWLGIGEHKSIALTVSNSGSSPSKRVLKRRTIQSNPTVIIVGSGKPSPKYNFEVTSNSNKTRVKEPKPSRAYLQQLKKARQENAKQRKFEQSESKRVAVLRDLENRTVKNTAVARERESLARRRRANTRAKNDSILGHMGRIVFGGIKGKPRKRRRSRSSDY